MNDGQTHWRIIWEARGAFAAGFANTVMLAATACAIAFILGCAMLYLLEGRDNPWRRVLRSGIDGLRMMPFLIFVYLLYYGLPTLGVRLRAWDAGLVGLAIYHGAYFAEILRGARLVMPPGSLEAAYAHGYRRGKAFLRIVLPQLTLSTRGILGNQLILCLKDTSFLSIITVPELTAAANAVQARYFIPLEAFIVAVALYWLLAIGIEALVRAVRRLGARRGFENG
ncbi:amino acid ABC transporter permease [Bordetella genomosp. 11]|uniref:ABC transporter permease n=1 Tax=Bordetella genomosp. 11 TaxID=1416808 RepID=A0A261ULP7_9BORD|nr:ABC transporter permease subunit [Bordetella genomosp. 11]OZI61833.1 ABC transporter permease [Bordetella genomosp. 11]